MSEDNYKTDLRFTSLVSLIDVFREEVDPEMPVNYVMTFLLIALNEGATLKDLQDKAGLEQSTVSRNVAALSERHRAGKPGYDLVEVRPFPDNFRFKCVTLKPKGRALVRKLNASFDKFEEAIKRSKK
jgi:DNA-binding MarR family transcriptional regulator